MVAAPALPYMVSRHPVFVRLQVTDDRTPAGLDPEHDLGEILFGKDGHDGGIDYSAEGEDCPATAMDRATVDIGAEKAHQEHQPNGPAHAAMIHVVGQEGGVDVGDLGGRDFGVFEIAVALGITCAESIGNPFGELPQIPAVA